DDVPPGGPRHKLHAPRAPLPRRTRLERPREARSRGARGPPLGRGGGGVAGAARGNRGRRTGTNAAVDFLPFGDPRHNAGERLMIRTENLTKKYGDFFAIRGIQLDLRERDLFGFIGPNGAGKTT